MSVKNVTTTISEVKDLIKFLGDEGVSEFEGFGIRFVFSASKTPVTANPFTIEDKDTREAALRANFKAMASTPSTSEEDLLWSTT